MKPTPPPLSPRKKRLFAAVAILLGSACILLVIGLGMAVGWAPRPAWLESRLLARRLAAQRERPQRMLVVGDSFLDRWPIDHCLRGDLQAYCDRRNIGLNNAAGSGYGPVEYHERITTLAPTFRPGLVLIFFYAGNDLTDVINRPGGVPRSGQQASVFNLNVDRWSAPILALIETPAYARTAPAQTAAQPSGQPPDAGVPPLEAFNWQIFQHYGIDPELIELARQRLRYPNDVESGYVNPHLLGTALRDRDYIVDNILMESERARIIWDEIRRLLLESFVAARANGADVCLVVIPSTVQVNRSHYDFYRRCTFTVDERLLDSRRPQDALAELCRDAAVPIVDLLPAFRVSSGELYFLNDDHLNQAGHELAFKVLREQFLDDWCARHPAAGAPWKRPSIDI
jgi:hypothetical protein